MSTVTPEVVKEADVSEERRLLDAKIAAEPILQFFKHAHLPVQLAAVSAPFYELALEVVENLPRNPERTVALRKLLEAKDAAVRALIYVA